MNSVLRALAPVFVLLVLASGAWAQQQEDLTGAAFVEQGPAGDIDWDSGAVTAKGIGAPPAGAANPAQARGMAKRAATVIARRNLLELLRGVQIDSSTTVQNFMVANDVVVSRIQGFLQNSHILDTAYMSDGSVEVTVGIGLRGGVADVVLPPAPRFNPQMSASPSVASPAAPDVVAAPSGPFTGLVVDARGLGVRPAMSPRIFDEQGTEVYGTAVVGRAYAIQQGMAGYAKDLDKALGNSRVAGKPFVTAALSARGSARSDLVISNAKAAELRALAESKTFLGQARVMILLD